MVFKSPRAAIPTRDRVVRSYLNFSLTLETIVWAHTGRIISSRRLQSAISLWGRCLLSRLLPFLLLGLLGLLLLAPPFPRFLTSDAPFLGAEATYPIAFADARPGAKPTGVPGAAITPLVWKPRPIHFGWGFLQSSQIASAIEGHSETSRCYGRGRDGFLVMQPGTFWCVA